MQMIERVRLIYLQVSGLLVLLFGANQTSKGPVFAYTMLTVP